MILLAFLNGMQTLCKYLVCLTFLIYVLLHTPIITPLHTETVTSNLSFRVPWNQTEDHSKYRPWVLFSGLNRLLTSRYTARACWQDRDEDLHPQLSPQNILAKMPSGPHFPGCSLNFPSVQCPPTLVSFPLLPMPLTLPSVTSSFSQEVPHPFLL